MRSRFLIEGATATVSRAGGGFLGTCFALRQPDSYLTAAHCVGGLSADDVAVVYPLNHPPTQLPVLEIERHPQADMALLRVDPHASALKFEPFSDYVSNLSAGEDFCAFGFPEDIFSQSQRTPTPRVFKGHYQRFFGYHSFAGFWYVAGEMSVPAPAGLSGGPVFRPAAPSVVTALVTENLKSYTTLDAVEETIGPTGQQTTRYREVISYGVALTLHDIGDWINPRIPRRRPSQH